MSRDKWINCGYRDVNQTVVDSPIEIVYDGSGVTWGNFSFKLDGVRNEGGTLPISFFGKTYADGKVKAYGCYCMRLYGASFYRNGALVAEFIPVVKRSVPGLYEKKTGRFYSSATGEQLTAGPKKVKSGGIFAARPRRISRLKAGR